MSKQPYDNIDPHEYLASDELPGRGHEVHMHLTPFWTMLWVFVILLILTALTVWSSTLHEIPFGNSPIPISGTAHILIAMTIAVVKAILVGAFFMHLLYDKRINTLVIGATIFALSLFIGLTLMDIGTRGMTARIEAEEIYPGGNVSNYKGSAKDGSIPDGSGNFQGNIVGLAQESGVAEAGNPEPAGHETEPVPEAH